MTHTLNSVIARIRTVDGKIAGAGVAVSNKQVLTCAHVIARALQLGRTPSDKPLGRVPLDLPLIAPGRSWLGRVTVWEPSKDVAGLVLDDSLDSLPDFRRVRGTRTADFWGHSFRAFGFPTGHENGVWASGLLRDKTASGWLQIEDTKSTGYFVAPGFSGTPVWDIELQGIVGIVAAVDVSPDTRAAFVIPMDILAEAWPELPDYLEVQSGPSSMDYEELGSKYVFVSYAPADRPLAERLHDRLLARNIKCWLNDLCIRPGDERDEIIDRAIRNCELLLIVITPNSTGSKACRSEWSRVLDSRKEIVPLVFEKAKLPFRLHNLQVLDFTVGFETGLASLFQYLDWRLSPEGQLQSLHREIAFLQEQLEHQTDDVRLKARIESLGEQVTHKERLTRVPVVVRDEYRSATQQGVAADREVFLQARLQDQKEKRCRVTGSAPQATARFFKNRAYEVEYLVNKLMDESNDFRAASIYGRAGIGKTALACEILARLEREPDSIYGIVYLSTRSGLGISLEQVYLRSARMLGGESEEELINIWTNPRLDNRQRIQVLLEHYGDKRCVILLDNLEELLDTSGRLLDPDLQLFLYAFLRQRHRSYLLITSRESLLLEDDVRRYELRFYLDNGLPEEDAVALLMDMDRDSSLGLVAANPRTLLEAVRGSHGYPRALEAIAGILAQAPLLSLGALLQRKRLFEQEVVENLVKEGHSRLARDARLVMQALSVYRVPVTEAAIRFLLEPFTDPIDVSGVLRRLTRGFYINVDRSSGRIALHPLDQIHSYRQIPDNGSTEVRNWASDGSG